MEQVWEHKLKGESISSWGKTGSSGW